MTKSYSDLMREARAEIREVTPLEADQLRANPRAALVDVREDAEWEQGHIPGAHHVARSYLEQQIEACVPTGRRPSSSTAPPESARSSPARLRAMGYRDVA
jgi:hypothetical protein